MGEKTIRTFIAIDLPSELRDRLGGVIGRLKTRGADVKWVRPASIHLTLRFIGEIPAGSVGDVLAAMERAASPAAPVEIEVRGHGTFPPNKRPRVIWVGLSKGEAPLADVFGRLEAELMEAGFGEADKRFSPHLTLGRVRSGRGVSGRGVNDALGLLEKAAREPLGSFTAPGLTLFKSELKPAGAVYTVLGETRFQGEE